MKATVGCVVAGIPPLISVYFRALGRPAISYGISIGSLLAVKVPLVLVLGVLGPVGVRIALPLGEILSAAAAWIMLRWDRRRASLPSET